MEKNSLNLLKNQGGVFLMVDHEFLPERRPIRNTSWSYGRVSLGKFVTHVRNNGRTHYFSHDNKSLNLR